MLLKHDNLKITRLKYIYAITTIHTNIHKWYEKRQTWILHFQRNCKNERKNKISRFINGNEIYYIENWTVIKFVEKFFNIHKSICEIVKEHTYDTFVSSLYLENMFSRFFFRSFLLSVRSFFPFIWYKDMKTWEKFNI